MEYRAGETSRARALYSFLMGHVPWYGPIYSEALRLEETGHHFLPCIRIIKRGLHELHRYGPLWFGLMRAVEQFDFEIEKTAWGMAGSAPRLQNVNSFLELAVKHISRELVWKLHFEVGQIVERAVHYAAEGRLWCDIENSNAYSTGYFNSHERNELREGIADIKNLLLDPARKAYLDSLLSCPSNLRWKVLLAGARMEVSAGQYSTSRELLAEAMAIVPAKSKAYVYLECARLEEFLGEFTSAREILCMASCELPGEWKISLEIATQHARRGMFTVSLEALVNAVEHHSNSGRMWALMIQLFSSAWKESCTVTLHVLWSLFEKTIFFPIYWRYLYVLEQCDKTFDSTNMCVTERSQEVEAVTDTEKSCESISSESYSKSMKNAIFGSENRSISESMSLMRSMRKLVTRLAIDEVPKSGECWCEAARTAMNPFEFKTEFDLASAHRCLAYAIFFTPQYGDSFIERVRLELLCQVILPDVVCALGIDLQYFYHNVFPCDIPEANEDTMEYVMGLVRVESTDCSVVNDGGFTGSHCRNSIGISEPERQHRRSRIDSLYRMSKPSCYCAADFKRVLLKKLYRRYRIFIQILVFKSPYFFCSSCVNADPNYGSLWFYCREKSFDDASEILGVALDTIIHELCATQDLYCRAIVHFIYKSISKLYRGSMSGSSGASRPNGLSSRTIAEFSTLLADFDIVLRRDSPHNLVAVSNERCDSTSNVLSLGAEEELCAEVFDGVYFPIDFSSALIELNRSIYHCDRLSREAQRTQIFCSDQVMP